MSHFCATPIGQIHWKEFGGSGPTIVLVHGLGGSTINWDAVGGEFARFGRTVALDLPGFGLSPALRDWTLDSYFTALCEFIETVGNGPVTLVGNSMGGLISETVAARRPDLVSNLILVSPATPPVAPDPRIHWPTAVRLAAQATPVLGPAISRSYRRRYQPAELVKLSLGRIAHKPSRIPPELVQNLVSQMEVRYQLPWTVEAVPAMARAVAGAWLKRGDFVAMIRDIQCPTLVVHGAEDPIVSPSAVEWLCSLRSDWELIVMEDTGHTPHLDSPVRFMGTITPWLRDRLI